jgi:hypothetical protein
MAGVGILIQGGQALHDAGPERIEMEIADHFEKIGLFLA